LEGDGTRSNRNAIGARVELKVDSVIQRRELMGGRSYLSHLESMFTFGLGDAKKVNEVRIVWPDGTVQRLHDVEANQVLHVKQSRDEAL
jgi:hypothetical protein